MADLENKIIELIKTSLPEQMQGAFKSFIEDIEAKTKQLAILQEKNKCLESRNQALADVSQKYELLYNELSLDLKQWESREAFIAEREKLCKEKENCHDVKIANIRLEAAENKTSAIFTLVDKVFSNPRFVQTKSYNTPVVIPPKPGHSGQYSSDHGHDGRIEHVYVTETIETEEKK